MNLQRTYQRLLAHFGRQHWWIPTFAETRFEVIMGSILVQRTAWRNVEKAIRDLKSAGLTDPRSLASAGLERVELLVYPAGFYRQKAKRIVDISKHLVDRHGGSLNQFFNRPIEEIKEELLSLRGIGAETADVILLYAGEKLVLPVGVYARRVFNRLGVRLSKYGELQEYFVENLPRDLETYKEFHALLVKLGKTYCRAKPECGKCPLRRECKALVESKGEE